MGDQAVPSSTALSHPRAPTGSMGLPASWYSRSGVITAMAPMVGQSDLPFRMICRRYGCSLVYSEMLIAERFAAEPGYRKLAFGEGIRGCDSPLVVQFAANRPEHFVDAALAAQAMGAHAVDLNLGCPQRRAREGHYGAYLTDPSEWGVCCSIIRAAASHPELRIPVTAKIRLQQDVSDSVRFAEMLADAGARLIAVHGRRRGCENQRRDGSADLTAVAKIVDALHSREMPVPVVTNGNVRCEDDISANLRLTGAKGIMVAEHLLKDPAVFARAGYVCPSVQLPSVVALAEEYVAAAEKMAVGMDDNRFVPATGDKGGYRGAVGLQEVLPGDAAERLSVWWANAEVVKSHLRSQLGERGALVSRNTFKRASTVEEVFSCFRKRFRLPQAASDGHATATSTRDGILSRQPPQEETPSDSG